MATCKASLDKSGRAGVQKIHLMQPLIDDDFDVPTRRDCFDVLKVSGDGSSDGSSGSSGMNQMDPI